MLAKELQIDDDAYRDLMATVCGGVRSAADLDISGRQRFISHLRTCLGRPAVSRPMKGALTGPQRRMWALWMQLADAGLVQRRTMLALCAFVERQTGVARLEWLNSQQERLVLESLKSWLKRGA